MLVPVDLAWDFNTLCLKSLGEQGGQASGPPDCHLLTMPWPLPALAQHGLGLGSWGRAPEPTTYIRGQPSCPLPLLSKWCFPKPPEALGLFCKMRSLLLYLSLLTAWNWVPGLLARLGSSQLGCVLYVVCWEGISFFLGQFLHFSCHLVVPLFPKLCFPAHCSILILAT